MFLNRDDSGEERGSSFDSSGCVTNMNAGFRDVTGNVSPEVYHGNVPPESRYIIMMVYYNHYT